MRYLLSVNKVCHNRPTLEWNRIAKELLFWSQLKSFVIIIIEFYSNSRQLRGRINMVGWLVNRVYNEHHEHLTCRNVIYRKLSLLKEIFNKRAKRQLCLDKKKKHTPKNSKFV